MINCHVAPCVNSTGRGYMRKHETGPSPVHQLNRWPLNSCLPTTSDAATFCESIAKDSADMKLQTDSWDVGLCVEHAAPQAKLDCSRFLQPSRGTLNRQPIMRFCFVLFCDVQMGSGLCCQYCRLYHINSRGAYLKYPWLHLFIS